jgi:hypothetical protein
VFAGIRDCWGDADTDVAQLRRVQEVMRDAEEDIAKKRVRAITGLATAEARLWAAGVEACDPMLKDISRKAAGRGARYAIRSSLREHALKSPR